MSDLSKRLAQIDKANRRRSTRALNGPQGPVVTIDGKTLVNFTSNDTLGFAAHPTLKAAAAEALSTHGHGAGAARLLSGSFDLNDQLEDAVAEWMGSEAALVFNSGYHANLGALTTLGTRDEVLWSDADNHASIIDGARLSRAERRVFPHLTPPDEIEPNDLVVTESVFSMEGKAPPANYFSQLQQRGARLIVDEAHALGWAGENGSGLAPRSSECRVGTFGKALGSYGAFVVGSRQLVELLRSEARSFIFTTGLPAPVLGANLAAIRLVQSPVGKERRERLAIHCHQLRGLETVSGEGPIFTLTVGREDAALAASAQLEEAGFLVQAVRPPTVPVGTSRLRVVVSASHTTEQVAALIKELRRLE